MVKLSIITINLNNISGLRKTIESVVDQTFDDFEYIIIDGGSTDGSVDIIKKHANKFDYWISEPDKGIYNAINKGILKAKGDYCLFLNSGDYFVDQNSLFKIFENSLNEDVIYWNFYLTNGQKRIKKYRQPNRLTATFFFGNTINHQSCLIKRRLFEKYGLYDENYKIASDWKFLTDVIIFKNSTYKHLDLTLTNYDRTGVSSTTTTLFQKERNEILLLLFPEWFRNDFELVKEIDTVTWMLKKSNFHPAVKFIFKSVNKLLSFFWIN